MNIAIACESGGFRCVFVHGVLDALEERGVRAAAYAAASASVLPAAFAATGVARRTGLDYWHAAREVRMREGNGMSEMVLAGIEAYGPRVVARLFDDDAPRFMITASEVVDKEAAVMTQGPLASRLGREQLIAMARGDDAWSRSALRAVTFDTGAGVDRLTAENFADVAYASTRMLHAWRVAATIDGRPYIDASYTVGFPVREAARGGAERIIAIATSHDGAYRNLYRRDTIPSDVDGAPVDVIAPSVDLKELGVDFTTASDDGLKRAYDEGRVQAMKWSERTAGGK
jgi:predicted acylesterase/phospholipase RssA